MLKNNNIIQKFLEPYLMFIKIISWEFFLFFSLFTLFLNTTLGYLIKIVGDKYLKPQNILSNQILWPFAIITLIFIILSIIFYQGVIKNKNKLKIIVIISILLIQSLILTAHIHKRFYGNNTQDWLPHDGITQTEVAINFLKKGQNPYFENYYNTALDNPHDRYIMWSSCNKTWGMVNPALENFVYMPLTFILPIPFEYIATNLFHFYDNRLFNFIFYLLACLLIYKIPKDPKKKIGLLIFFALNDFLVFYRSINRLINKI
jgi:hypothetical protein